MKVYTKSGYTLIEMLIYLGISGFVIVALSSIVIASDKEALYIEQKGEVYANRDFIEKNLVSDIQRATVISQPSVNGVSNQLVLQFMNDPVGASYQVVNGVLLRTSVHGLERVNSETVSVKEFLVTRGNNGLRSPITISLHMLRGDESTEFFGERFLFTVTPRN